ncbi:hypothetical protein DTO021C3_8030 [Paecilomyces variotii]|nr:hypothetical protein DTO021C3_8030 [Paecilomyces variotii]KAJ9396113.1 hypothetical protein DTO282F9_6956 [Paecilomyces variotii]
MILNSAARTTDKLVAILTASRERSTGSSTARTNKRTADESLTGRARKPLGSLRKLPGRVVIVYPFFLSLSPTTNNCPTVSITKSSRVSRQYSTVYLSGHYVNREDGSHGLMAGLIQ